MKKLLAVLLALSMLTILASCGSKTTDDGTTTSAPEESTEEIVTENTEAVTAEPETTEAEESTEAPAESTEAEKKAEKETEKEEETEKAKVPQTKEEIIACYNEAVNGAVKAKAGFGKERYTDNAKYDMSIVLNTFKSLVEKFIGIGDKNKYSETVAKGQWASDTQHQYLRNSTLTAGDITNAAIKEDGKNYIVTLDIKGASSVGNKNSKQSSGPIDKCGLCVGNEDKNYYDHKSGPVIYDAIGGTFENAEIKESYSNAKAVAKIDSETGRLVSLTVTFDIKVDISGVGGNGTATGTTHVIYKDFKY